jgi:hypothetical protein
MLQNPVPKQSLASSKQNLYLSRSGWAAVDRWRFLNAEGWVLGEKTSTATSDSVWQSCRHSALQLKPYSRKSLQRNRTLENKYRLRFKQGPAREVLQIGEQPTPEPGPGEVRVHVKTSGVNPSDWKSRSGRTSPMSAPLIIPHSDGAGDIDRVGPGVANRVGERVWVWNGQWRRPHGTAAEYIVLPSAQAVLLPEPIDYYPTENVGQRVKTLTDGHGVDALIELDLSTNGKDYPNILRPHATVVVYGMSSSESTLPTLWLMRNSITLRALGYSKSVNLCCWSHSELPKQD